MIFQRSTKRSQVSLPRSNGKRPRSARQNAPRAKPLPKATTMMPTAKSQPRVTMRAATVPTAVQSKAKAAVVVVVAVVVAAVVDETGSSIGMVPKMRSRLRVIRRAKLPRPRSQVRRDQCPRSPSRRLPRHANQATPFACTPSRRKSNSRVRKSLRSARSWTSRSRATSRC
jgi:hypothetical protein